MNASPMPAKNLTRRPAAEAEGGSQPPPVTVAAPHRPPSRRGALATRPHPAPQLVPAAEMGRIRVHPAVKVATQQRPQPRLAAPATPTLAVPQMVVAPEVPFLPVAVTVAAQHRPRPQPRPAAIPQLPQATLLLELVVTVLRLSGGRSLTARPAPPTQPQAQQYLGRARPPPKRRSITAPALALLWRQARRMRVLGEACRHPLPLL